MVGNLRQDARRLRPSLLIAVLCLAILLNVVLPDRVHALQLQQRSLAIGSAVPGATTTHTFTFSYATLNTSVGSLVFQYCDSPLDNTPCNAPAGMNASRATLTNQVGEGGYFVLTAQTNQIILTRAPAVLPRTNPSQYTFSNIVNPTTVGTFYVRISTYTSTDGSGSETDFGAVANAITQGIDLNTEVPPILKFCVGLTVATDCSSAEGSLIDLGTLTTSHVASGTSQMVAATNAQFGLTIAAYGTTMTSGNNVIPALTTPTPSAPGNAQFGLNLRANSDPAIGQDPSGNGVSNPTPSYNNPNHYMFVSGDTVATSPAATDLRKFTASYIVNIPPDQPPGVYTATITYICTASF